MKRTIIAITALFAIFCISTPTFATHALRGGFNIPAGFYGEYEFKPIDRIGLFANIGGFSGDLGILGSESTHLSNFSWGIGMRLYLIWGFYLKAGYTYLDSDGESTDTGTSLKIDTTAVAKGFDLGLGWQLTIGPVLFGLDGGVIFNRPDIRANVLGQTLGGIAEVFDIEVVPQVRIYVGAQLF